MCITHVNIIYVKVAKWILNAPFSTQAGYMSSLVELLRIRQLLWHPGRSFPFRILLSLLNQGSVTFQMPAVCISPMKYYAIPIVKIVTGPAQVA